MKTSADDIPVLLVGGRAIIAPDELSRASKVVKPEWSELRMPSCPSGSPIRAVGQLEYPIRQPGSPIAQSEPLRARFVQKLQLDTDNQC